jgi:hypothetical protein
VVADDSVAALANTLAQAVADIAAGDDRHTRLADEDHLVQSDATAKMIKFYQAVIERSHAPKY